MNPRNLVVGIALAVLVVGAAASYTVGEAEQVIITQFGNPIGDPITTSGLHFKVPFIQQIHSFEKRFLEWDGSPNQVPTRDKRFIWVDTYARWRNRRSASLLPAAARRAGRPVAARRHPGRGDTKRGGPVRSHRAGAQQQSECG